MGLDINQWKERIASRSDMTGMVTHLTKPPTNTQCKSESEINQSATANLIKILQDRRLSGSTTKSGFIVGQTSAVCFQDVPLYGLIQNVEHEYKRRQVNATEKLRYCGVGIAFSKWYIFSEGGRPVFYEETAKAKDLLPETEHWRIVNLKFDQKTNKCIDWMHEREWRFPGDFSFKVRSAHVLLYDKECWDFF